MTLGEAWRMDNGGLVRTVWCPGRSEPQPVMGGGEAPARTQVPGWLATLESSDTRSPSLAFLAQDSEVYSLEKVNQSSFRLRDVRHS